jgi:hypothetical protein
MAVTAGTLPACEDTPVVARVGVTEPAYGVRTGFVARTFPLQLHEGPVTMTSLDSATGTPLVDLVLPCCPDCNEPGETLLASHVAGTTYRIAEVPVDTALVGLGDLVAALAVGERLEFLEVAERRCLASCSFTIPGWIDRRRFLRRLRATGVAHREVVPQVFMCNLDSEAQVRRLQALLRAHHVPANLCDHATLQWQRLAA